MTSLIKWEAYQTELLWHPFTSAFRLIFQSCLSAEFQQNSNKRSRLNFFSPLFQNLTVDTKTDRFPSKWNWCTENWYSYRFYTDPFIINCKSNPKKFILLISVLIMCSFPDSKTLQPCNFEWMRQKWHQFSKTKSKVIPISYCIWCEKLLAFISDSLV